MIDYHKTPAKIITNHLAISGIGVSPDCESVHMICVCYDLHHGDFLTVEIEVPFERMYSLLNEKEVENDPESILAPMAEYLADPKGEDMKVFDAAEEVCYYKHVFCLRLIVELNEFGELMNEDEPCYFLDAYMPAGKFGFEDLNYMDEGEEPDYYNKLLAIRYHVYLHCKERMEKEKALNISNLEDPLVFDMSRKKYEEMSIKKEGK